MSLIPIRRVFRWIPALLDLYGRGSPAAVDMSKLVTTLEINQAGWSLVEPVRIEGSIDNSLGAANVTILGSGLAEDTNNFWYRLRGMFINYTAGANAISINVRQSAEGTNWYNAASVSALASGEKFVVNAKNDATRIEVPAILTPGLVTSHGWEFNVNVGDGGVAGNVDFDFLFWKVPAGSVIPS